MIQIKHLTELQYDQSMNIFSECGIILGTLEVVLQAMLLMADGDRNEDIISKSYD